MSNEQSIRCLCFHADGHVETIDVKSIWRFITEHNDCYEMEHISAKIGERTYDLYFDGEYAFKVEEDRNYLRKNITGINVQYNPYSPFIAGTTLICLGNDETGESESLTDDDIEHILKNTREEDHRKLFLYDY